MADLLKRNIYLESATGNKFDLLRLINLSPWLADISGFGFNFKVDTSLVGKRNIVTSIVHDHPSIKGNLIFQSYEEYNKFIKFINDNQDYSKIVKDNSQCLKLYYHTTAEEEAQKLYYRVFIKEVAKTEKEPQSGLLKCPVEIIRLSNRLRDRVVFLNNSLDGYVDPTFALPTKGSNFIKFGAEFTTFVNTSIVCNNLGLTPCKVTFDGIISNPVFVNNTNGYDGKFNVVTPVGGKSLLISDANYPQKITLNGSGAYNIQGRNEINYLYLSQGVNNINIVVTDSNLVPPVVVKIEFVEEYL